ncbi:hypothetical protein B566_EDAN014403 [Ephemera danica]|nr:hypothetical protein B566_EDAN014403 [Ephemera danica]
MIVNLTFAHVTALDLAQNSNVQDAFVIAVEQQARERLERLSALKRIKPVDMTKLSQQLNQIPTTSSQQELNGFIESSPIYVTSLNQQQTAGSAAASDGESVTATSARVNGHHLSASASEDSRAEEIELKQELGGSSSVTRSPASSVISASARPRSPFHNGRTEKLIGPPSQDAAALSGVATPTSDIISNRVRTTAIVELTTGGAKSPVPDNIRSISSNRRHGRGEAMLRVTLLERNSSLPPASSFLPVFKAATVHHVPEATLDYPLSHRRHHHQGAR